MGGSIRLVVVVTLLVVFISTSLPAAVTYLLDDFNGNYIAGNNGFLEEHFKVADLFATLYYDMETNLVLPPTQDYTRSQRFEYARTTDPAVNSCEFTYFETRNQKAPTSYMLDLVGLLASRGQDPIDLSQPITYRVHIYGRNDVPNPNDSRYYWRQVFDMYSPGTHESQVYWTGANNNTWQTLQFTHTGLESGRRVWLTFGSGYPKNYGYTVNSKSIMIWENLEIDYTPLAPQFQDMIVVADSTDFPTNYFHVENEARNIGFRCQCDPSITVMPHKGDRVTLWGSYTSTSPEKVFKADTVKVISSNNSLPRPLGIGVKSAGGKPDILTAVGPNNIGLLVRVWGRITMLVSNFFYVDDGSHAHHSSTVSGVWVYGPTTGLKANQFVVVTGIVGAQMNTTNKMPIIRMRSIQDVQVLQ